MLTGAAGFGLQLSGKVVASERAADGKSILLQIYFKVAQERASEFEKMFDESYVPALRKQQGYIRSDLLRLFPEKTAKEIEAAATEFNYQMELVFDTEENRRKWVASREHAKAWPAASDMAEKFAWRGYDVAGTDEMTR
jgi:antibiotic biosynthesis monooxygenase (ABM) superfamily enzyme